MQTIKLFLIAITSIVLSGCTTLSQDVAYIETLRNAGISNFSEKIIVMPKGSVVAGIERTIVLGREVKRVELVLSYTDNGKPNVKITASGVTAFEGQRSSQIALIKAREQLTKQNIAVADIGTKSAISAIDVALKMLSPVP